jgi:hypothetical protein
MGLLTLFVVRLNLGFGLEPVVKFRSILPVALQVDFMGALPDPLFFGKRIAI